MSCCLVVLLSCSACSARRSGNFGAASRAIAAPYRSSCARSAGCTRALRRSITTSVASCMRRGSGAGPSTGLGELSRFEPPDSAAAMPPSSPMRRVLPPSLRRAGNTWRPKRCTDAPFGSSRGGHGVATMWRSTRAISAFFSRLRGDFGRPRRPTASLCARTVRCVMRLPMTSRLRCTTSGCFEPEPAEPTPRSCSSRRSTSSAGRWVRVTR